MYRIVSGSSSDKGKYYEEAKNINMEFQWRESSKYFFRVEDGKVLAYIEIVTKENKRYINDLFVKEELRYKSYGRDLLQQVINYLADDKVSELYVRKNQNCDKFFLKSAFILEEDELVLKNILKEKNRRNEGLFGTYISIAINIFLTVIKIFFGIVGNSKALIADGFHSMSDVLSSVVIIFSIMIGSKPADDDHPYGHGKAESIAGIVVGVLLLFTAFELILDIVKSLFEKESFAIPDKFTLIIAGLSIVIKFFLYIYKDKLGKKLNNDAILADARDHKSDVISTLGVLIGILLSIYIHPVFDILTGIVVAIIIGREGLNVIFETSNKIMDKQDKEVINEVYEFISQFDEISNVHDILLQYSGDKIYLSFHVRVDKNMRVLKAHDLSDDIKLGILEKYPEIENVIIHIDPAMN